MCTRYITPEIAEIERDWEISRRAPNRWWEGHVLQRVVMPLGVAPFVRAQGELTIGQWGMIPPDAKSSVPASKTTGKRLSTVNARAETMAKTWTYRTAWARGQRCLIPATSFDEPYWGTGKNIWWRFARADGRAWALAGLWSEWINPETGEIVPNFTMLTTNADSHPLFNLMHKPDPKLPPDQQDKRSVVPIERENWDAWLHGTHEQAEALIHPPALPMVAHGAADPALQVPLPIKR